MHPKTEINLTPCNADDGSAAGLYTKGMYFRAGEVMPGHLHVYDHPTLFACGKFEVEVEGIKQIVDATQHGQIMLIRKDKRHQITALTDGARAFCIHVVKDADGEIASPGQHHLSDILKQIVIPNTGE